MYNNDDYDNERAWYVIQSYAGMEYAAKRNLERRIVSMNMEDYIFNVLIPEEIHYELKTNGEKKEVITNPYPGYIFVDMIVTDESWFVVRNTPMVTGFLGSSGGRAKPVPVPMHEMIPILKKSGVVVNVEAKFKVGDKVKVLSETFLGQEATVESIEKFGAFVNIQGFRALLPISELSFDRVADAGEVVEVGQELNVKVIHTDWKNERVSVSLKALLSDPWEEAASKFPVGTKVDGKISKIMDFGLFVNLDKGIDGLVHISELEDVSANTNLRKVYKIGQEMSVVVTKVDAENKRISLQPASSAEQDQSAAKYMSSQDDDGETYNPFAALLKK